MSINWAYQQEEEKRYKFCSTAKRNCACCNKPVHCGKKKHRIEGIVKGHNVSLLL